MLDPNVLVRSVVLGVNIRLVNLPERGIKTFRHDSKDRVPLVQLLSFLEVSQTHKEGRSIHVRSLIGHSDQPRPVKLPAPLFIRVDFIGNEGSSARDQTLNRCPATSTVLWVPCLGEIVLLDIIEETVVVVLKLAKLQKVFAGPWTLFDKEVYY